MPKGMVSTIAKKGGKKPAAKKPLAPPPQRGKRSDVPAPPAPPAKKAKPTPPKPVAAARKALPRKQAPPAKKAVKKAIAKVAKKPAKKDEVVEVEKILGVRYGKKGLEYRIKWKTSGKKDVTWEPEDNIMDDDLLDEFEEQTQAAVYGKATIKGGDKVEVKNVMEGFQNSWTAARVSKKEKSGKFTVEYTDFVDSKGKKMSEAVDRSRLRVEPPKAKCSPAVGDLIEILEDDCWWEARVMALPTGKSVEVMFRVSDEKKTLALGARVRDSSWLSVSK